jgi:hypothetical protein
MAERDANKLRETYWTWKGAHDRFHELMQQKLRDEPVFDDEVKLALAELERTRREFEAAAEPFMRKGPRLS